MACSGRQLTQAQLEAGFDQQRTGVTRAIRPFTGEPTAENLAEYLNREVFPVLKQARDKINEVYLPVVDNSPSANPLGYYFSSSTANADPTTGFIRLDNADVTAATTIRVSQNNGRTADITPWLEVMSGSVTAPLGVVTIAHAINPSRFARYDLTSMTDQGAYWDMAVTHVESSHTVPFVQGDQVAIQFIPGVSSAGATIPAGSLPALSGAVSSTAGSSATLFAGILDNGAAENNRTNLNFVSSTSVTASVTDDSGNDELEITVQRAALTGAIAATANSNATLFAGIRDNGSAENDRTNLNFLNGTGITSTITDDAGNDELEIVHAWNGTTTFVPDGDKGHVVVSASGATWLWDTTISITGAQEIAPTGNLTLSVGADLLCNSTGGTSIYAGATPVTGVSDTDVCINTDAGGVSIAAGHTSITNAPAGDVNINATNGIGLKAGNTPNTTGVADNDVCINAEGGIDLQAGGTDADDAAADDIRLQAAGGIAAEAGFAARSNPGAGDVLINATSGVAIHAGATQATTTTGLDFTSDTTIALSTNGTERLEIEADGAWQVAGDTGATGEVLTSQGNAADPIWVRPTGLLVAFTIYRTSGSGTHTFNSAATSWHAWIVGGGGGGGGANSAVGQSAVGAGGGGGRSKFLASSTMTAISYAVGSGGAGGANTGGDGGNGGTTSLDADTAPGGSGGPGSANVTLGSLSGTTIRWTSPGGPGGTGGAGTFTEWNSEGEDGDPGVCFSGTAGLGGKGGATSITCGDGPGCGGQGAFSSNNSDQAGEVGRAGIIIIWEFS